MSAINKIVKASCLLFGLSVVNVFAAPIELTPGLWEHRFKMSSAGMDPKQKEQMEKMQEEMAKMPPETREMMQKMMNKMLEKSQGKMTDKGMQTPFMNMEMTADGAKLKVCVTKEDVARGEMPTQSEQCTEHHTQMNSKTMKIVFECMNEKGGMETHGETDVTFENSKSYTGKSTINAVMQGKAHTMQTEQSGKWLSSDCGDIKPYKRKALKTQ